MRLITRGFSIFFTVPMRTTPIRLPLLQYNTHQTTAAMGFPTWVYFSLGPVFFVILALRIVQFETQ